MIRRYRMAAMSKAIKGLELPLEFISIAQDATDQMNYGYPKGAESTHKEANLRLKGKVMITMVHGFAVYMYILPDDTANGPDESIECLQRTLKHEEIRRGGALPATLCLQFDNCFRENKNSYTLAYLCWLVERGVFRRVYLSFHPVGHTHNECDQCASRISIATAHRDIYCRCELTKILEGCYTPRPVVETIRNVVSFKQAINPDGAYTNRYPRSSTVRQACNIKDTHFFLIHMDLGQVVYRDKTTIDQQSWSEPISPWKTGVSGLRPEDLVQKMSEVIKPEQLSIIKKTLEAASFRLGNGHHQQCVDADYARICTPVNGGAPIHWSLILITMSHISS